MKKTDNDFHTSTVDGAAAFENYRSLIEFLEEEEKDDAPDQDREDEDDNGEEDRCRCSDPGCPCPGNKRGTL